MDLQEMNVDVDRDGSDAQGNQQHWDEQQSKAQLLHEHRSSLKQENGPSFAELTQSRIDTEA